MAKQTALSELNQIFEANKQAIADIYVKHGFSNIPVSPLTAGVAYKLKPEIADDLAPYLVPEQYNNAGGPDDDKKARRQQLAGAILGFLGNTMQTFSNVMGPRAAANQVQQNGYIPGVTPPPSTPPPSNNAGDDAKKKILGLSYFQFGLVAALLLVVILAVVLGNKKPSPAASA